MKNVRPVSPAVCTRCSSRKSVRVGFNPTKKLALWVCSQCGSPIVIPSVGFIEEKAQNALDTPPGV